MEFGALVCKARAPNCDSCPAARCCTWNLVGGPAWDGAKRRGQSYAGTDRQCRGQLLDIVRNASDAVPVADLVQSWSDQQQSERALASLVADGLLVSSPSTATKTSRASHRPAAQGLSGVASAVPGDSADSTGGSSG